MSVNGVWPGQVRWAGELVLEPGDVLLEPDDLLPEAVAFGGELDDAFGVGGPFAWPPGPGCSPMPNIYARAYVDRRSHTCAPHGSCTSRTRSRVPVSWDRHATSMM